MLSGCPRLRLAGVLLSPAFGCSVWWASGSAVRAATLLLSLTLLIGHFARLTLWATAFVAAGGFAEARDGAAGAAGRRAP